MALGHGELPNRHPEPGAEGHFPMVLDHPPTGNELPINLQAGPAFRPKVGGGVNHGPPVWHVVC